MENAIRTSRACLSGARVALGWVIAFFIAGAASLFGTFASINPRRRELPFPLADLLGHHGGYVKTNPPRAQMDSIKKGQERGVRFGRKPPRSSAPRRAGLGAGPLRFWRPSESAY